MRGVELKKGDREGLRKRVEGIIKETGAVAKIEGIRRIGRRNRERRKMLWVKFASIDESDKGKEVEG